MAVTVTMACGSFMLRPGVDVESLSRLRQPVCVGETYETHTVDTNTNGECTSLKPVEALEIQSESVLTLSRIAVPKPNAKRAQCNTRVFHGEVLPTSVTACRVRISMTGNCLLKLQGFAAP